MNVCMGCTCVLIFLRTHVQAEKSLLTTKQTQKAITSMLNKRCAEVVTAQADALEALIAAVQSGNAASEVARLRPELPRFRSQASQFASAGLTDADVVVADTIALRAMLKETEDANAALIRRVRNLEIDLSLPESARIALTAKGTVAAGSISVDKATDEEMMALRSRVTSLSQQLRDMMVCRNVFQRVACGVKFSTLCFL
jgi:hypothetical protein